jgi:hypothetical protein
MRLIEKSRDTFHDNGKKVGIMEASICTRALQLELMSL